MLAPRQFLALALWFTVCANIAFFVQATQVYSLAHHGLFVVSLAVLLFAVILLFLVGTCWGRAGFYVAGLWLLSSALAAYFMDSYQVVIDKSMLENALLTHASEVRDLLSVRLGLYLAVLFVLPWTLLWGWQKRRARLGMYRMQKPGRPLAGYLRRCWQECKHKMLLSLLALGLIVLAIAPQTHAYASFFREHKLLRLYSNPITPVYGAVRLTLTKLNYGLPQPRQALDAQALRSPTRRAPRFMVVVVGETARADHFGLNGYARNTTPQLAHKDVVSMRHVTSCGTSTAESLPCMFSHLGQAHYSVEEAQAWDNALDVLAKSGVRVLWRDNNQDSKGVAEGRAYIRYEDYRTAPPNTVCDPECRDRGMLHGLHDWMQANAHDAQGQPEDVLIVLHQMGSHGPAYYKRYSSEHAVFEPECRSNMLERCSHAELINAFDNTIVATDDFLARTLDWLQQQQQRMPAYAKAALIYVSDHGESLGENGVYLHGLPKMLAPKAQTAVPMLLWTSDAAQQSQWRQHWQDRPVTHDVLFHSVLGYFTVQLARPGIYQASLDLFAPQPQHTGNAQ